MNARAWGGQRQVLHARLLSTETLVFARCAQASSRVRREGKRRETENSGRRRSREQRMRAVNHSRSYEQLSTPAQVLGPCVDRVTSPERSVKVEAVLPLDVFARWHALPGMSSKAVQATALAPDAPRPLPRLPSPRPPSPVDWIPVLSRPVECQADHFHRAILELVRHPEQSSSTILRADILADEEDDDSLLSAVACGTLRMDGYRCVRRVRRRILPNRPQFDWAMEQECLFYDFVDAGTESLAVLLPDFDQLERDRGDRRLPYYHPQVYALAFRYLSDHAGTSSHLRIDLVPLPSQPVTAPLPPNDRLFRTAQMLAKYAAKICNGQAAGYQKRIHHDLLVGRTAVQDTYQRLKDRYQ